MTTIDWIFTIMGVAVGLPVLAYLITKMIVYGKKDAEFRFDERHKKPTKEEK